MHRGLGSKYRTSALAVAGVVVASLTLTASAGAVGIQVTSPNDPSGAPTDCTLRDALESANTDDPVNDSACTEGSGADTITFAASALPLIQGGDEFEIASNVTIQGPGSALLSIDGVSDERVFHVTSGSAAISGLTIENGLAETGGGIRVDSGASLNLDLVVVSGNDAARTVTGPTINASFSTGGGIHSDGVLVVDRSTFFGNTVSATASGGATSNNADAYGGGIYSSLAGQLTVMRSTLENNSATASATGTGSKFDAGRGGGVSVNSSINPATIALTTIVGNAVSSVTTGGNSGGGGVHGYGGTSLISDTITSNLGSPYRNVYGEGGMVEIQNTLIADNGGAQNCLNVQSNGHNMSTDSSCDFETGDQGSLLSLHLLPIDNYGGPTRTRPPEPPTLVDNTVIDQGVAAGQLTDQRGGQRTWLFDTMNAPTSDGTDAGAVEIQGPVILGSTPASPGDSGSPLIFGSQEPTGGLQTTLYSDASCGTFFASGPGGAFSLAGGIAAPGRTPDSSTTFSVVSYYGNATSACSNPALTYIRRPTAPALGPTEPLSGSNNNSPIIKGTAPSPGTVNLYLSSNCSGAIAGTGSSGDLAGAGIALFDDVADNSPTTLTASTVGTNATSSCSAPITYNEVTPGTSNPGSTTPPATTPAAKKCKKGTKLKKVKGKRKCVKKKRK